MANIRQASADDLAGIVDVHLRSFQGFFLTFLGGRFLRLLYREILREPGNVSLVALSTNNEIIGFVVGVCNQVGLYRRLVRQRWYAFAMAAFHTALQHPSIVPRLFRAFKYPSMASHLSSPGLLMSVAVAPDAKGTGVGRALVERFLSDMADNGISRICLTTDRDNNVDVNEFYRRCGFSKVSEFRTSEGRWMNEYAIQTKRV